MNFYNHVLNPIAVQDLARSWLKEDLPGFDIQGLVAPDLEIAAKIFCKSPGVLAGIPFVNAVFHELNCSPNWFFKEGEWLEPAPICEVAYVGGKSRDILLAERIVLNVLARCSGVATQSRIVRSKLDQVGWKGHVAGTRKTTPGFRIVEKYGLLIGGASTHRYDLSNMVMLKDNHITICGGSIHKAITCVKEAASFVNKIEVECRSFDEAKEAAICGADIIMLDNFKASVRTNHYLINLINLFFS